MVATVSRSDEAMSVADFLEGLAEDRSFRSSFTELLRAVPHPGVAVRSRISERPLWLSTAGLGVSWLHVRRDSRPKYYRTAAYRG